MDRVPLVDLEALHRPLQDDLRAAADRVLRSGRYILGPELVAFESELAEALGMRAAVGVSSGTDALLALLMAVGVQPGDEVVTTPYSFFATTEAILRLGARPVFADIDPATGNLDADAALARLCPRTRAVMVVHLFGRVMRLESLRSACSERGIALLEDAAQAIGAAGVGVGRGAALSFFPTKNLGGFGDGGAVVTEDADLAASVRSLRNHGTTVDKMRHERLGGNFRLDELQAALLRVKLRWLSRWTEARRALARAYLNRLHGLPLELPVADDAAVWNQFVMRVAAQHRDPLRAHLDAAGISSAIYYPTPLHLQPAAAALGGRPGDFPNAERAARESLALPIYPGLPEAAVERITRALGDFFA